jgi:hypothetical protein
VMARPLATVLIAAMLGSAGTGGVFFRCRLDGLVRTACCCEHERSMHEHAGVSQATAGGCCDLVVRSPATREAIKVDPAPRLADSQPVVLPTPTARPAAFVPASALRVSWTCPPRLSGPLFLQSCSLLI